MTDTTEKSGHLFSDTLHFLFFKRRLKYDL